MNNHLIRNGRVAALALAAMAVAARGFAEDRVDFNRDIRPILSAACFQCHGPDASKRKAELRLDTRDGAFAPHDDRVAFAAGKPDASEAYRRITSDDPDERMPPAKSGKSLTERQIELIRAWIEQGAAWHDHWAFVSPQRPAVPQVKAEGRVHNAIDAFIIARLERDGLSLAAEADKTTLLRRLSLDLIGLPPTIAEVDAFLVDDSPDAWSRQVERLLSSPHYGERWGRHWLDAARYADSDGYEKDKPRQVWFYRDWVIDALNRDLPYNQFLIEQIAGDLLPGATQDQIVATGFLRNSMINEEGGVDPEQFRMEAMFDRLDAIGKSILGLTIQCAQCHNHKFDPLTQEDYYRMFSCLNNDYEANVVVYSPAQQAQRAEIFQKIGEIEKQLQMGQPDWPARLAAWQEQARQNQPEWVVLRPTVDDISNGGQKYLPLADGSFLAAGYAPTKHRVKLTVRTDLPQITGFRLELLTDPNLPCGGPGRSVRGTGALTEFEVEAAPADAPDKATRVKLAKATADLNLPETPLDAMFDDRSGKRRITGPIDFAIDGKDETAWGIDAGPGRRNQPRVAVFSAAEAIANPQGTVLTFYLKQNHGGWNSDDNQNCNLGRVRLSITTAQDPVADAVSPSVRALLTVAADQRTPAQTAALFSYWRTTVPEFAEANAQIEALWRQHPEGATQLALAVRPEPRETHLLQRGDFLKPMQVVPAGVPAFLHAANVSAGEPPRLTFARWLADARSPTTGRAIVNRVWQAYFGTGIVATVEDLGSQAETPTHPELLDWLTVEFQDRGWRLKELHRLIVHSATYRQASQATPELIAADPYNRLLARGARLRVEGEIVRDIALAASGLLNPKLGGPSVCPPAPDFLFLPPASYGPKIWREQTPLDRYRRGLYTFRYRSAPYPMLQAFDAPNGDSSCVRRVRSNSPLQALTTLNEPLFLECARALALRTVREGGSTNADRLTYSFRLCVARNPTDLEYTTLMGLYDRQFARFNAEGGKPWELAAQDPAKPPELPAETTAPQLGAWTAVARVLLNLDETITKE